MASQPSAVPFQTPSCGAATPRPMGNSGRPAAAAVIPRKRRRENLRLRPGVFGQVHAAELGDGRVRHFSRLRSADGIPLRSQAASRVNDLVSEAQLHTGLRAKAATAAPSGAMIQTTRAPSSSPGERPARAPRPATPA